MSTYDKHPNALEKDVAVVKQDIVYKLNDTNSAVGIIKRVLENQGRNIKFLINQTKTIDLFKPFV